MIPHYSLLSNLVYAANGSEVTDVIINGKIVMQDRRMATIDEDKLIDSLVK
ncbi:hypothetical protein H0N95_02555 [Candidatus Micrarchaeota archaeon]|nr:hypothetical protein [Candidatus Micrarchaeota archaeon]